MRVTPSRTRSWVALVLPLALWFVPGALQAQVVRNFDVRFETRDNGDIHHLGNTLLTCPAAAGACASVQAGTNPLTNNHFSMVAVDADGDATTTTSSSADLALSVDQTVLWAGLYWGAESTNANRYDVRLRTPASGTYVALTATQQDVDATDTRYSGFVDVTALVQAGGSGNYWVADVQASTGGNRYAGWSIIVVTADPNEPLRSLQVFDGYARVTPSSSASMTASGLIVPPSGPVNTRMGTIVYEGDLPYTGDELRLNGIPVGDGANPTDNFNNSVISRLGNHITTKNPNYQNQLGYDATYVDVSGFAAIPNGSTSATIDLSTTGDWYYPAAVSFATDLHSPEIQPTFLKTITDVNGAPTAPGDTLEYVMSFANTGDDAAINVVMTDTVPGSVSYAAGSLTVVSGANAGAMSDTPGNDQADFDGSVSPAGEVVFRLGTGADGVSGGRIAPGDSTSVRFRVVIDSAATDGASISSRSHVGFDAETSGINGLSAVSNEVITTVVSQADLSVVMTGPGSALLGDTLVYEVVTSNGGPQSAADVVVTDTLPAGLDFVSATRGASHSSGVVTWPSVPLSSGASLTDSVTVVTATIGTHTNFAAATSSSGDPDTSNSDGSSPASQQTTLVESDTDGDGEPDTTDADDDGDGIPDVTEGDGTVDTDGDGIPDSRDTDSDDDGIPDNIEAQGEGAYVAPSGNDTDGDGLDDAYDSDNGGTALIPVNTDSGTGDTQPDYLDTDSDGDGVPDSVEGHDADMDGQADRTPTGDDDDNDGLDNAYDPDDGGTSAPLQDTDSDSVRDWRDTDDDGDGDPTDTEDTDGNGDPTDDDSDGDGIPDYLDPPEAVDLAARKEAVGDFHAGQAGVFRIVATNVGATPTAGTITVVDTLPGGLNYQSARGVGFTVTNAGQVVTGTHPGPIAVGDSVVLTINVDIDADLAGDFVNRATVTTPRDPGTDGNNTATTLPVPVIAPSPMMLEKGTTRLEAEIGDMVSYSLRLANVDDGVLTDVTIIDRLPAGFSYLPGSAQRNQVAITDPAGTPGPELTFDVGELGPQESVLITYSVRVGVGAQLGDGVNRAQAQSSTSAATSNEAAIKVQVRAGAFSDDAFVAGKVFASGDGSLVQGAEALGVPGVRVYLQDGTSAVTDSEGKFSFFGLRPRLYVVRVDQSTLPPGARLAPISNRHSDDGRTLFVDLTRGELHRADFAETSGDPSVWQSIKVRRTQRDGPGQMFGDGRVDRSSL
ncbi:MAG: hypothetical protein ACR2QM_12280, partial [Longimicrobiales bacterium]